MASVEEGVILFIKAPVLGTVKTRLADSLSQELVLKLYRSFVEDLIETLRQTQRKFYIYFTPREEESLVKSWLGPHHDYRPQVGNDLGQRMQHAMTSLFDEGLKRVILIGSDSPDLPAELLLNALNSLNNHDLVLGPTLDGGFYLIGAQKGALHHDIFQNVEWSSEHVLSQTLQNIEQAQRSVTLLPDWEDIDTFANLEPLVKRNKNTEFKHSKTYKLVRTL